MDTPSLTSSDSDEDLGEIDLEAGDGRVPQGTTRTRKRRTMVTREIVSSIVSQMNQDPRPTIKDIAANVDLAESTVKRLLRKIRAGEFDFGESILFTPKRKGRKPILSSEKAARVKAILTADPTATLETARNALLEENVSVSVTTTWRLARMERLTVQKVSLKPNIVFTARMTEMRFQYAQRVEEIPDQELWFLDESGFNLHLASTRRWAVAGETPVQPVPPNRQENMSLLMCISLNGVRHFVMQDGAFHSSEFVVFLTEMATTFPQVLNGNVCLVMDNVRIHHSREATGFMIENGIRHIFLPAYSPELNPIENVFGVVKEKYRSMGVARTRAEMYNRLTHIVQGLNNDLVWEHFYRHMRRYVRKALNRQQFN